MVPKHVVLDGLLNHETDAPNGELTYFKGPAELQVLRASISTAGDHPYFLVDQSDEGLALGILVARLSKIVKQEVFCQLVEKRVDVSFS